jgi:hydrogenase maturation factor HypE
MLKVRIRFRVSMRTTIKKGKNIVPKLKNKSEEIGENVEEAAKEAADQVEKVAEEL